MHFNSELYKIQDSSINPGQQKLNLNYSTNLSSERGGTVFLGKCSTTIIRGGGGQNNVIME